MQPKVSPIKESIKTKYRLEFSLHLSFALLLKMYCPPTQTRIVSRDPILIFAIVSKCFIGSTYLKVGILVQDLIHHGLSVDFAVGDGSLRIVSPSSINRGELNLPPIVRISGIDQKSCDACH